MADLIIKPASSNDSLKFQGSDGSAKMTIAGTTATLDNVTISGNASVAGSSMVMIKSETAPTTGAWDIEDCFSPATYDVHKIVMTDITISTPTAVYMRLIKTDGTVESSSKYTWGMGGSRAGGVSYVLGNASFEAAWKLCSDQEGLHNPMCCVLYMNGLNNSNVNKTFHGTLVSYSDSNGLLTLTVSGRIDLTSESYDGIRLYITSGNIDGGRITTYGIKHS